MAMQAPEQGLDVLVGRNVHMLMWDRRLTQTELGARIGMDQSSLGKRLRGERGWTLDQLRDVAAALETTIAYLVGEVGDQSVHPLGLEPRTHWFRAGRRGRRDHGRPSAHELQEAQRHILERVSA